MTDEELKAKATQIDKIIGAMRQAAKAANQPFDGADLFFRLAGLSPAQLRRVAQALGV
jgi:hypothetical protein